MNGGLVVPDGSAERDVERLDTVRILKSPQSGRAMRTLADALQEWRQMKRLGCGGRRDGGVWLGTGGYVAGLVVHSIGGRRRNGGTGLAQAGELAAVLQPIIQDLPLRSADDVALL